jgi:hypothetical protein
VILMALTLQHLLLVLLGALSVGPKHPVSALTVKLPTDRASDNDSASLAWLQQLLRHESRVRRPDAQVAPATVGRSMQGAKMISNGLQRASQPAIRHVTQCSVACNRQSSTRKL